MATTCLFMNLTALGTWYQYSRIIRYLSFCDFKKLNFWFEGFRTTQVLWILVPRFSECRLVVIYSQRRLFLSLPPFHQKTRLKDILSKDSLCGLVFNSSIHMGVVLDERNAACMCCLRLFPVCLLPLQALALYHGPIRSPWMMRVLGFPLLFIFLLSYFCTPSKSFIFPPSEPSI